MQIISVGIQLLMNLTVIFLAVYLFIVIIIFIFLSYKKNVLEKREQLKKKSYILIDKAIFHEGSSSNVEGDEWMKIPSKFQVLLKKKSSRAVLTSEIIKIQKNITGVSRENLQKLYEQLGLKQDALRKLRPFRRWYFKAEGIQELSVMNQRDCLRSIYRHVNNKNEFIRMEAQSAAINFMGFHGLRFLNFISYPMSEWQQLKLMEQLSHQSGENFSGVKKWLKSSNDSVILFALKLIKVYHRFELHDAAAACLNHANREIRKKCMITMTSIYTEDTASLLIRQYAYEEKDGQLAILDALYEIRDPGTISFLTEQLQNEDNEIKLVAAKAIMAAANGGGMKLLNAYAYAQSYPWIDIIQQLKEEMVV